MTTSTRLPAQRVQRRCRVGHVAAADARLREQRRQHLADRRVVVDHQDAAAVARRPSSCLPDSTGAGTAARSSPRLLCSQRHVAAVRLCHAAHERQPEPAARRLGRVEVVDRALARPRAHAQPRVLDRQASRPSLRRVRVSAVRTVTVAAGRRRARRRLEGVRSRFSSAPATRSRSTAHSGRSAASSAFTATSSALRTSAASTSAAHQVVDLHGRAHRLDAPQALVLVDHALEAIDLLDEQVEELGAVVDRAPLRSLLAQELRGALQRGERVLEVVRHLRGQAAQRRQPHQLIAARDRVPTISRAAPAGSTSRQRSEHQQRGVRARGMRNIDR